jgi:AraC-like DNA-binding protein
MVRQTSGPLLSGKTEAEWRKSFKSALEKRHRYRDIDFSATVMADELGISPYVLSRLLRKVMGASYADLVNGLRIADARKMLADARYDEYTVDEIGLLVGFRNRQSFFASFRKLAGATPQCFRNESRGMQKMEK